MSKLHKIAAALALMAAGGMAALAAPPAHNAPTFGFAAVTP